MAPSRVVTEDTLNEVLKKTRMTLRQVFPFLAGERVPTTELASTLGAALGISPESLTRTTTRLRPGVLDMFAAATKLSKHTVWGVFTGRRRLGRKGANTMEAITGIKIQHWLQPETQGNWLIDYVRSKTASGKRAVHEESNAPQAAA